MAAILLFDARRRPLPRVFRERADVLGTLRDREVVERYRLSREAIFQLLELIEDDIGSIANRSHPVPPLTKLLVTLRFLAKGDFFSEVGDLHGISRSSVSRHVWQVVTAIDAKLNNINFPSTLEEISEIKRRFFRVAGLPNCLGAVDGTLVPILAPPGPDEPVYVCRKGYHALNIQAVTDASMRFTDVVARWPGSTHDATVFQMCGLRQYLEGENRGWLLGDSGYPLRPYLMTPKTNPGSRQEEAYNLAHSQTRMVVERAFGLLKSRFRCLHKTGGCLPFSPEKCAKMFVVCAKLHNLCLNEDIPLEGDLLNDVNGQDYPIVPDDIPTGVNARAALIDLF